MCIKPYTHIYIMNSNFLHVKKACFSSLFVGLISILQSFSKFPQSHSHAPCPNLDLVFSEVLVWYIWSLGFLTSNSVGGIVSYNHSGSLTCSYYPESSHSAILFSVYQMPGLELEKKMNQTLILSHTFYPFSFEAYFPKFWFPLLFLPLLDTPFYPGGGCFKLNWHIQNLTSIFAQLYLKSQHKGEYVTILAPLEFTLQ